MRHHDRMRWYAVMFILCDVIIAASMVALLSCRESSLPKRVEWFFPVRGRWLRYFLVGLTVVAYASLAPGFLYLLIHHFRH
jgi:hypothetical protein